MTAHSFPSLAPPDQYNYRRAADRLHDAHDAVESIEWRLRMVAADAYEKDDQLEQSPSLADVGALWARSSTTSTGLSASSRPSATSSAASSPRST